MKFDFLIGFFLIQIFAFKQLNISICINKLKIKKMTNTILYCRTLHLVTMLVVGVNLQLMKMANPYMVMSLVHKEENSRYRHIRFPYCDIEI